MVDIVYKKMLLGTALLLSVTSLDAALVGDLIVFEANTSAKASEVNANFDALKTGVVNNAADIALNTGAINSNATDIGLNTDAINANSAAISTIQTDVTTLGTTKQNRVSSTCAVGSSIRAINTDGTVVCEIDDNTDSGGDITRVIAGAGLAGGGLSGDVTLKRASGKVSVSYAALTPDKPGCILNKSSDYSYFDTASTLDTCRGKAGVNLPDGATITSMTCSVYSNDATAVASAGVKLYRHTYYTGAIIEIAATLAGADSISIQTITDASISVSAVNNELYSYLLTFIPPGTTTTSATANRFYGCGIAYTY